MKKYLVLKILLGLIIACAGVAFISGCKKRGFETQYYSAVYSVEEGGRIEGVSEQQIECEGSASTVIAVANAGYKFVGWSDGIETATRTDENITADITVKAKFEKLKFTVKYETDGNGYIDGLATQTVSYNESASTITAIQNKGYKFIEWSDGIDTAERTDRNITENISVTANFEKLSYAVKYESDGNGYIVGEESQSVSYGESASTITAVPNTGYKFVGWSDGIDTAERTDRNVTEDISVTAKFEKLRYSVQYLTDGGGYIIGGEKQSVEYGENGAKVTAIPNNGYKFVKWSDGVTSDVRQDLNVKENIEVVAEFEFLFAGGNGTQVKPFMIENYSQLLSMRSYPDQNYTLANDLDLKGINHEPIFDDNEPFSGSFTGNGKTIDNMTVATDKNYPSLFGFIFGGIVTNLNLSNVNITTTDFNTQEAGANYCVGAVAGYSVGLLYEISVDGNIVVDSLTYDGVAVGGLAGMAYNTVLDCDADVQITVNSIQREHKTKLDLPFLFGGLLGVCDSAHVISCNAQGEINIEDSSYDIYAGGLIGYYFTDRQVDTAIKDSHTNVEITESKSYCNVGGLIGRLEIAQNTSLQVTDCWVKGNIISGDVGGFVCGGFSYGELLIENCHVVNEINVFSNAAGFINRFTNDGGATTIKDCSASNVLEVVNQSGAAWGFAYQVFGVSIMNCFSSGSCTSMRGGGFAWTLTRCYVERCYSDNKIDSAMGSGAFVYALLNSEIVNCYSKNEFESEPTQGFQLWHAVIPVVRHSKTNNFYYSGNIINYVVGVLEDSEIENFHCLKNEKLAEKLIYLDRGEIPSPIDITVYESKEEMYSIADILNNGLLEEVWVNQDKDFPKLKVA